MDDVPFFSSINYLVEQIGIPASPPGWLQACPTLRVAGRGAGWELAILIFHTPKFQM
jgi:hypothetical protein